MSLQIAPWAERVIFLEKTAVNISVTDVRTEEDIKVRDFEHFKHLVESGHKEFMANHTGKATIKLPINTTSNGSNKVELSKDIWVEIDIYSKMDQDNYKARLMISPQDIIYNLWGPISLCTNINDMYDILSKNPLL